MCKYLIKDINAALRVIWVYYTGVFPSAFTAFCLRIILTCAARSRYLVAAPRIPQTQVDCDVPGLTN